MMVTKNEFSELKIKNISKSFGPIKALKNASLTLNKGEVVAILGDNGSGKSTLVKILSGDEIPDGGIININNQELKRLTAKKAIACGISTVYQDLALDNYRNVPMNIFLGREYLKFFFMFDYKKMKAETEKLLSKINISILDLDTPVGYLSGGQRQSIAIARAIYGDNQFIILDEPTAAMGVNESKAFLDLVKQLVEMGKGVLLISHNIEQVHAVADRVYVMHQGTLSPSHSIENDSVDTIRQLLVKEAML